jgi:F0F1-type ATP synthase membrane subunit b/b'
MGFLDRLLGRSKEEAEDVGQKAEEMGQKAEEMGKSGAERAEGMAGEAKSEVEEHLPGRDNP